MTPKQSKTHLRDLILQAREVWRGQATVLPDGPVTPWSQRVREMMTDKDRLRELSAAITSKRKRKPHATPDA